MKSQEQVQDEFDDVCAAVSGVRRGIEDIFARYEVYKHVRVTSEAVHKKDGGFKATFTVTADRKTLEERNEEAKKMFPLKGKSSIRLEGLSETFTANLPKGMTLEQVRAALAPLSTTVTPPEEDDHEERVEGREGT